MRTLKEKVIAGVLSSAMVLGMLPTAVLAGSGSGILINEIEMDGDTTDWVELINTGSNSVDISGWIIVDDKGLEERLEDEGAWIIPDNTVLEAGAVFVIEQSQNEDWSGLGKKDTVTLYDKNEEQIDSYTWESVAVGTYARDPETSAFVDQAATKGTANIVPETPLKDGRLVINEVNSAPDDWIEFMNIGERGLDISGYQIRDNSDDHRWKFPEGTTVTPGALFFVKAGETVGLMYDDTTERYETGKFDIGIGSGDSIRLYDDKENIIDEYSWTAHASYDGQDSSASYGRYPDGTGSFVLTKETPNAANEWYAPQIVINEVESDDLEGGNDWVEIYNVGSTDIDISGYYLLDNDEVGHKGNVIPVAEGTVLKPGAFYVFDGGDTGRDFQFGLGKADTASVFNKDGVKIATYTWTAHASGVYARIPDGTGELQDFATATKGKANIVTNPVVINEVQSNDPNDGPDWIELANPTGEEIDVSGLVIKDNSEKNPYTIPNGTKISANGFLVLKNGESFEFGLGKGDSVRIFEEIEGTLTLIQSTTWPSGAHTSPTWGLYPDANGAEYRNTMVATPGETNKFADIPDVITWPGDDNVNSSNFNDFLEDSSGLDFRDGKLYAVDNGTATIWVMDVAEDGTLSFSDGFANGKQVAFQKDADDLSAKGPDSEGITADANGLVYLAVERDNAAKGVNYNVILKVDPNAVGDRIVASQEWDITDLLPQVAANMGIEAVEWVANEDVKGKLFDKNTNAVFNPADYPGATAEGVFFIALEDNGHVYVFVLNNDGSAVLIADIDSKLGGAMALNYDEYENILWGAADNGYNNKLAQLTLNGTVDVDIVHVAAPTGLDVSKNYEGFAIAEKEYTVNEQRPVYRFEDGVVAGDLCIGSIACDYNVTDIDSDIDSNSGSGSFSGSYNYPVSTPEMDNGDVKLSDFNAVEGEVVTATVTPDNGYGVAEVIVTDEDGNIIPVEFIGNGQYTFVMPDGEVSIEVVCKPAITMSIGDTMLNIFGKTVKNDVAPTIGEGNRTMLPIRAVANALGAEVYWDADNQKVTIVKEGKVIEVFIGKDYALVDGERIELDAKAYIENDRTYLQVRFITEALDAYVIWDPVTGTVTIIPN